MYKKTIVLLFFIAIYFFPTTVQATDQESIKRYDVILEVQENSDLEVTERIIYNFGANNRHGIYREIPIKYKNGISNFSLRIKNIHVEDETGNRYTVETTKKGSEMNIRIGDEDLYVTGERTYIISYTVQRAFLYLEDKDELYWNTIGNQWVVPIQNSTTTIMLPKEISKEKTSASCYVGEYSSNNQEGCVIQQEDEGMLASLSKPLQSYEGYTVAYSFPKGIISAPSQTQRIKWWIGDNGIILLPIAMFAFLFPYWFYKGRDPKGTGTIIARYSAPDNLTPGLIGTLVDERLQKRDFSASIIYLATEGYIKIKDTKKVIKKDWTIISQDKILTDLPKFEKQLYTHLLGSKKQVTLSSLKNKFYKSVPTLKNTVYTELVKTKYFLKNPEKVKSGKLFYLGISILFGSILLFSMFQNPITIIAGIITAAECIAFAQIMPKKTKKGVMAKEHILGFKEYLKVAEKDRINFHNAPEKNPELFEKYLPYAMALGVEKAWAKQFQGMYNQTPSWYEGNIQSFSVIHFTSSLTKGINSGMNSAMTNPGSTGTGGGGFSGGGFGGGGGGSW